MKSALFINGSPHKNGSTVLIMKMIEEMTRASYISKWVNVYDLALKPCIGCCKCRPDSECALPEDDGQRIGREIAGSDLIIIGSSVYWGNITAPLKMIFDRNVTTVEHFLNGGPAPKLAGKKGIIVVTGGSGADNYKQQDQGGGAIQAVKTVLQSGGVDIIGEVNVHSSWNIKNQENEINNMISKINIK